MGYIWKQSKHEGVRFREHPTRRHGVGPDKYFAIRYRVGGKRHEEALGWSSWGWSASKAAQTLAKLQEAARTGEGETSLAEKRQKAEARRQAEVEAKAQAERDNVTFGQVFLESYLPHARQNKAKASCDKEDGFFRNWIADILGNKPMASIAPFDVERLKKSMLDAGKSPKTTHYCLGTVRQVFNFARDHDLFLGANPVNKVKKPTSDNRRIRFLTQDESRKLLSALSKISTQVHDMALLSLHCGLRAGEIFGLTWSDVDMERGSLALRDTKNGRTRPAIMTEIVRTMFLARERGAPSNLVFPARGGGKAVQISDAFNRTVLALGFNTGIVDRRQKVVFHTLRHTFASWLAEQGTDLYTIQCLMGHQSFAMVQRYAHLSPDTLRRAVKNLEASMKTSVQGQLSAMNSVDMP